MPDRIGTSSCPRCQWRDCKAEALRDPVGRGRVGTQEVDLYLCEVHRDLISRGVASHVSIAVEPTPASPA